MRPILCLLVVFMFGVYNTRSKVANVDIQKRFVLYQTSHNKRIFDPQDKDILWRMEREYSNGRCQNN